VPKAFPLEFRRGVVAVARGGEASIAQVARDFGVSESCVQRWLRVVEREDGITRPGSRSGPDRGPDAVAAADRDAELKELRKRTKLLEQENEILRRAAAYLSRDLLPE